MAKFDLVHASSLLVTLLLLFHPSHGVSDPILHEICSQTSYPDQCFNTLQADPGATSTDLYGLGTTVINLADTDVLDTIPYISSMLENAEPEFVNAFKGCLQGYTAAKGDLSRASKALDNHEYNVLDTVSSDASEKGRECEQSFMPYPSPLTDRNQRLIFLNEVLNVVAKKKPERS